MKTPGIVTGVIVPVTWPLLLLTWQLPEVVDQVLRLL